MKITKGFIPAIAIVLTSDSLATLPVTDGAASDRRRIVIEDFESYTNDTHVAKAWYHPHHGAPVRQTLDLINKGGGRQGLRVAYATTPDATTHYAPFCRVAKWDLSGCNAAQFWFKPDGSGRQLTCEFNIANPAGRNIHDLWSMRYVPAKGDTSPRIVSIPFSKLVHNSKYADSPDTSPVFKPGAIIEIAFYIGARNDEPGEGVYYFDEITAFYDPALGTH